MSRVRSAQVLIFIALACAWPGACLATASNLERDIEKVLAEEALAGIAWTLIGADGEVVVGSAGMRDVRSGAAFNPDARFLPHYGAASSGPHGRPE
jgi:hypothetical protein